MASMPQSHPIRSPGVIERVVRPPEAICHGGPVGTPKRSPLARSIRRSAAGADARFLTDDELERRVQIYSYLVADDRGTPDDQALRQAMYRPAFEEFTAEQRFRADLRARGKVQIAKMSQRREALTILRDEVKARVSVPEFFRDELPWVEVTRRSRTESSSPCPVCGGTDRFRIFDGMPSQFWCRRCEWSGDVLTLAAWQWQLDIENADGFRMIVTTLAERFLGLGQAVAS